jgi:hypothetical protein
MQGQEMTSGENTSQKKWHNHTSLLRHLIDLRTLYIDVLMKNT